MFVRVKTSGERKYLQVVKNRREGKKTIQQVIATLGRLDKMAAKGEVDILLRSLSRFAARVCLVEEQRGGQLLARRSQKIGPELIFGRLWKELYLERIILKILDKRAFSFPVEKAVFVSVLNRIFASGSDRKCERWLRDVSIGGAESLSLHHFYRAMRFLGEEKERIEELLFENTRDLFTQTTLAFFDTTSVYFEGDGGQTLGEFGHSKDRRPDLKQMVIGAVLTGDGRPLSCEMWPGNKADAKSLLPVVDSTRARFGIESVCWVADRGMASKHVIEELEARSLSYILGARLRTAGVRDEVLTRAGRYREVGDNLRVKEVRLGDRRYVICHNPEEARADAVDREAILASLKEALQESPKALIGNRGYRRFLTLDRGSVKIDLDKVKEEALYDGKFVLLTNTALASSEVAIQYKRLLMVEQFFRAVKSLLKTRPVFHKFDSTIRGHIFVSFLALVLIHELKARLKKKGLELEWADILRDLEALQEVEVLDGDKTYLLRTELQGVCGKIFQAVGVAIPPPVKVLDVVPRP